MEEAKSTEDTATTLHEPILNLSDTLEGTHILPSNNENERLSFRVGNVGVLCAVDAVREILAPLAVGHIPHTPEWLLGVANVRGTLIPVVDLALAFSVDKETALETYMLIAGGSEPMGLLIDGLPALSQYKTQEKLVDISPPPELLQEYVSNSYKRNDIVWLDVDLNAFIGNLSKHIGQENDEQPTK